MGPTPTSLHPLIILITTITAVDGGAMNDQKYNALIYNVYMDSYGTCQQSAFFEVQDEEYAVYSKGSGQAYQIMRCSLRFKTYPDQQLCVKFNSFKIDDCNVYLKVYQEHEPVDLARQPSDDCLYREYSCESSPQTVCSTDRYMTVQLYKERIGAERYDFSLQVVPKTMQNEIIMSLGVMVGVIVGVVVVIAILAILLLYCCCKKHRHHGRVFRKKKSKPRSGAQGRLLESGPEPSAPPLDAEVEMHQHIVTNFGHYLNEPPPPYEPKPEPV
ncbi:uncharacterized protein LOC125655291 isoform X2 [Ostrea edulis]|uniref:uncharacterized protein LOC125655291 isoform X2 n=1 Tax=Ostrea edulis TaxID=37623 RepID=UPI0024AF90E4|nr:uncharacterized protein LOC125655291 isoform X2 [Ostrea edulis]XP_048741484.2 uncharacterized protein LOC125655291 isoform X2 [Ostrea edulis]